MSTVGEIIGRHHHEILSLWTEGAGRAAVADRLSSPELVSMMPEYLTSLGQRGSDGPIELSDTQQALIERHLSSRLRQGFVLNEIITEFAILGRCVSRLLDATIPQERPTASDVARFFCELHAAVAAVTRIFNEHMLEDQQLDKRHDRLLRRIASAAMGPRVSGGVIGKMLDEALTVVMAAMGAQTAALLLFDVESNQLVVSASTGVAHEVLGSYVSSLDASTFVSEVAVSDEGTMFVSDAETTQMEVSEELRQAGIYTLLGIRLAAGHLLRGVLYVGRYERRAFTPSEIRRTEDLGTSLTMHIDNARLHAALGDKVRSAEIEGRLRERFVSVLMHDLTGPLAAARANAEQLRAPHIVDDPDRMAARIVEDLDRMEWIVRGLLDVHRIRAGQRLPMQLADCDLGEVARDAAGELRAAHGDHFRVRGDEGVRGVWCAEQLRRAIWNVGVNAVAHGAPGRPVVITVTSRPSGAEVSVHNEGPAMPAHVQADLFHPFSLPGSAAQGVHGGWGLGLTFVWGCMEAHGGQVVAESGPGLGTTFRLLLPSDSRPYVD